jgi:adenosylcobyric acid synthase
MLTRLTGRPVLGTVPYVDGLWLDAEDSLSYGGDGMVGRPAAPHGKEWLRVAVARLPRMSNVTDVEALAAEPGVRVRLVTDPAGLADADLVVLPGSKSTVDDLRWLRDTGLADAVHAHAASGRPVLGICGGYQMLGEHIVDEVESGAGTVPGLGLLPLTVTFAPQKTLGRPAGTTAGGQPVTGYEIHHGRAEVHGGEHLFTGPDGTGEGCRVGAVAGTHWHGAFESDGFRREYLADVARAAGRGGFTPAPDTSVAELRERTLDLLGDLVEEHLDTGALLRLIEQGPPAGLPFVPPGAPA